MEKYKKSITIRVFLLSALALLAVGLGIYLEILFMIGLCLAVFVMIMLRYALLPDFYCGLLGGISVSLLLGAGTLKHMISDTLN